MKNRFMELEGLRGMAAIVVVIYHALIMFYPGIAYGSNPSLAPVQNMRFEDNLYGSPLNVFLSGGFAVAIFFVLSGFVLSVGFFQTGKESIIKKLAIKRYVRLMIPALVSVLLVFLLISLGFAASKQAAVDIAHSGSLDKIWALTPNFFAAFKEGAFSIFTQSGSSYNAVLWTMHYEFVGSFLVFITLIFFGSSMNRVFAYGFLAFITFNTWFLPVVLGMILADLYAHGVLEKIRNKAALLIPMLVTGLVLGGYPILSPEGTFYQPFRLASLTDEQNTILYLTIGAVLVIVSVLYLKSLSSFFAMKRISILGKYTYSLYLTHTLVLFTLGSTIFVTASQYMGISRSAALMFILCAPVIALVAWGYEKYVDSPAIKLSNYFSDLTLSGESLTPSYGFKKVRGYALYAAKRVRYSRPVLLLTGE